MITNDELHQFEQSIFTGVTVGIGSLVLLFSTDCRIMIQCPFKCGKKEHLLEGHGEDVITSSLFFPILNHMVETCSLLEGEILHLSLSDGNCIYIYPEDNGFESYVITTSQGDYPVIAC